MTINPGAAEFPHRQIAAQLRERIRRGDWAARRTPAVHPGDGRDVRRGQADRAAHRRPAARRGHPDHQTRLRHVRPRHPPPAQPPLPRPVRRPPRLPRRPGRPVPPATRSRSAASPHRRRSPTRSASATAPRCWSAGTSSAPTTPPVEVGASWFRVDRRRRHLPGTDRGVRPAALPGGRGGDRAAVRLGDRHDQRPPAQPGGGRDPADPAGHPGAAPAARRVRRRPASRSRWPRRPGPVR